MKNINPVMAKTTSHMSSSLTAIVESGDHQALISHLNRSHDVKSKNLALLLAIARGHTYQVPILLESGADVLANNNAALIMACESSRYDLIDYFIRLGADVRAQNNWCLRWAAAQGDLALVGYFSRHGADLHDCQSEALGLAAKNGHLPVVRYLVKRGGCWRHQNYWPLRKALKFGHLDIVLYFTELEPEIWSQWYHYAMAKTTLYHYCHIRNVWMTAMENDVDAWAANQLLPIRLYFVILIAWLIFLTV